MSFHDEVEIEDMDWSEDLQAFTWSCPCGDLFQITIEQLEAGEEVATCPSCSLLLKVIYDPEDFAAASASVNQHNGIAASA